MYYPNHREAPPTSLRKSGRLLRKTRAVPELAGPSGPLEPFTAAVTGLQARYLEWATARGEVSVALAARHEARQALDQQLRGVGLVILMAGRGRRSYGVYLKYYPRGYGQALGLDPAESLGITAGVLAAMTDETDPDILARREPLMAARALLESAMSSYQAAVDALGQAKAHLEREKLAWRKAYTAFYFSVRTALFDRRDYVESLFRSPGGRAVEEEPTQEEAAGMEEGKLSAGDVNSQAVASPSPSAPSPISLVPPLAVAPTKECVAAPVPIESGAVT